jgi:hypothetical protein
MRDFVAISGCVTPRHAERYVTSRVTLRHVAFGADLPKAVGLNRQGVGDAA